MKHALLIYGNEGERGARARKAGQPVTFTREQLMSFYPLGTEHQSLPVDLGLGRVLGPDRG